MYESRGLKYEIERTKQRLAELQTALEGLDDNNKEYHLGQWFRLLDGHYKGEYILATMDGTTFSLISVKTGDRWRNPVGSRKLCDLAGRRAESFVPIECPF